MAQLSKKGTSKFVTPFRSSQSSSVSSSYPNDGFDDSMLWYPDGYVRSQASSVASTPTASWTKPVKPTPQHQKTYKKQKTSEVVTTTPKKNVRKAKKRKDPETIMPPMPRTPKTPSKVSRIIPSKSPRTPTRQSKPAFATPRTPTFEMYGVKQMLSSQKSTPGISPGKIIKRLQNKHINTSSKKQFIHSKRGTTDRNGKAQQLSVNVESLTGMRPPTVGVMGPPIVTHTAQMPTPQLPHNQMAAVVIQPIDDTECQTETSQPTQRDMIYNFRLSPGSIRKILSKKERQQKEDRAKLEVLHIIERMAADLSTLRRRRHLLRSRINKKANDRDMRISVCEEE